MIYLLTFHIVMTLKQYQCVQLYIIEQFIQVIKCFHFLFAQHTFQQTQLGVTLAKSLGEFLNKQAQVVVSFVGRTRFFEELAQGVGQKLVLKVLQLDHLLQHVRSV